MARAYTRRSGRNAMAAPDRADVMERIDRLQQVALTAQRDDDVVNFGAAERPEKIALGVREEVRAMGDQVNAMVRQIQRLQTEVRQLRGEP